MDLFFFFTNCRLFFMDGVVLSRVGLNTIRRAMVKGQPKRPPVVPRQKNPQASATATPDAHSAVDTAPPSVYTPVGIKYCFYYYLSI